MPRFDNEELDLRIPNNGCPCKTCSYRMEGPIGYRNAYCKKFPNDLGKPNKILFQNAKCDFYKHE